MKLFSSGKDGGYESTVWGFWFLEIKRLCSIVLLCFEDGTREAYHNHAFNTVSWVLKGRLEEHVLDSSWDGAPCGPTNVYTPSFRPVITRRTTFHQVRSKGRTWVISFRGPWAQQWQEFIPAEQRFVTLTNGRREISAARAA